MATGRRPGSTRSAGAPSTRPHQSSPPPSSANAPGDFVFNDVLRPAWAYRLELALIGLVWAVHHLLTAHLGRYAADRLVAAAAVVVGRVNWTRAGRPGGLGVHRAAGPASAAGVPRPGVAPGRRRCWAGGLRIHDLRHTAVALWIAAGANPKEVSARAGHAPVSFTLDRYGHLHPEADAALRERLDALYGTARPVPPSPVVRLPGRARRGPSVAPGRSGDDESAAGDAATTP